MPLIYDGRYEFVRKLGEGGFGSVFLAKEKISNRQVAIKQLNNKDKTEQDIIIHEIQTVAQFNHRNIASYHHHFWQDDLLFLVMEFCAGGSLQDKINDGEIASEDAFRWIALLAKALQVVHDSQIIHHDIKPHNILFTDTGIVKITDFGVANTAAGTRAFMSPEALEWENETIADPRVDVYALGVTLLILLSKKNPFYYRSKDEILEIHNSCNFGINNLPEWQQEIILKAINKVPELRFQSMSNFEEAILSKSIPFKINKDVIQAGEFIEKARKLLESKKWTKAGNILDFGLNKYPDNVNIIKLSGIYHLMLQNVSKANEFLNRALHLNPRLDVQKELGWINLELCNYPKAISLLSDHLHRNPSDFEAYNLLLQCFYETDRYEIGMDLAKSLLEFDPANLCFANNYYVCCIMHNIGKVILPDTVLKAPSNEFIDYNLSVILESSSSHNGLQRPTLKSKLLFLDYRFNKFSNGSIHFIEPTVNSDNHTNKSVIKFGRENFDVNDIKVPGGTAISRRHCLIINCKNDAWIYDLDSTNTYVNNRLVVKKTPLLGLNVIRIGRTEYTIKTDNTKLL